MLNRNMRIAISAVLAFFMGISAFAATNARIGSVNGENVTIRESATTQSAKMESVSDGTKFLVIGSKGKFYQVKFSDQVGYISDEYAFVYSYKYGTITAENVILRKKPNTSSNQLDTLDEGDEVNVYGKTDDFYLVTFGDYSGYIYSKYVSVSDSPNVTVDKNYSRKIEDLSRFTDKEINLVAQLIYAEGKNQTSDGYKAMASVVYNRLESKRFPSTIWEIVFQTNQFSVVRDVESFLALSPSKKAKHAVESVFVDGVVTLPSDVMYFKSASLSKEWGKHEYYATYDGNMYYKQ